MHHELNLEWLLKSLKAEILLTMWRSLTASVPSTMSNMASNGG